MQIIITGQQIDLGDTWRERAQTGVTETISKFFSEAVDADVRVARDGADFRVEIVAHPAPQTIIAATGKSADAYSALDEAISKMARQLRKYKNRLKDHQNGVVELVDMSVINVQEEEEAPEAPVIVAEMQTELPECTVAMAVMRMDLADQNALMFRNAAHGGLNMVYRRADGNIGWVDPKGK